MVRKMYLCDAQIGQKVRVVSVDLDVRAARRLQALGMIAGTVVTILHKKGSGTLILDLRGTRFALGSDMTRKIGVSVCGQ